MSIQINIIFLVIIEVATYAYIIYVFSKEPGPLTAEFGMSLNASLAFLIASVTTLFASIIILLIGDIGYAVISIIYPFLIPMFLRRIIIGKTL